MQRYEDQSVSSICRIIKLNEIMRPGVSGVRIHRVTYGNGAKDKTVTNIMWGGSRESVYI